MDIISGRDMLSEPRSCTLTVTNDARYPLDEIPELVSAFGFSIDVKLNLTTRGEKISVPPLFFSYQCHYTDYQR